MADHPELSAIRRDVAFMRGKLTNLEARCKNPEWAKSAQQHLASFEHAFLKAWHDLPIAEKIELEEEALF